MRRGIVYTIGGQLGIQAIGLGTGVLIARLLGPDGRGQLAAIITWASMLAYLGNLGLPVAFAYASARYPQERHQLFGNGAVMASAQCLLLALFGWIVLPKILAAHGAEVGHLAVLYLWAYVPFNFVGLYANAIQQGSGQYGSFNAVRLTVPLGYAFVLLLLWAVNSFSVVGVVLANLVGTVLAAILALGLTLPTLRRVASESGIGWLDVKNLRRDLRYGLSAQIGTLQPFSGLRIDVLALTLMTTTHELGLYVAALAGANLIRAQGYALGQVVLPEVAGNKDVRRQKQIIWRIAALAAAGAAIAAIVTVLWPQDLLQFVYGSEFVSAATTLEILVLAGAVKAVERVLADGLRGMGRPSVSTKGEIVGLSVGVPALVVCIPLWAGVGAAVAVLGASLASLFAAAWWGRDELFAHSAAGAARHAT